MDAVPCNERHLRLSLTDPRFNNPSSRYLISALQTDDHDQMTTHAGPDQSRQTIHSSHMQPPDPLADRVHALLVAAQASLPLGDNVVRFAGMGAAGGIVRGCLSDWDETAIDRVPGQLGWSSPDHVELVVWRRASTQDRNVVVGMRIQQTLFGMVLSARGEVRATYDGRAPLSRNVALFLVTLGLDRPLLGSSAVFTELRD